MRPLFGHPPRPIIPVPRYLLCPGVMRHLARPTLAWQALAGALVTLAGTATASGGFALPPLPNAPGVGGLPDLPLPPNAASAPGASGLPDLSLLSAVKPVLEPMPVELSPLSPTPPPSPPPPPKPRATLPDASKNMLKTKALLSPREQREANMRPAPRCVMVESQGSCARWATGLYTGTLDAPVPEGFWSSWQWRSETHVRPLTFLRQFAFRHQCPASHHPSQPSHYPVDCACCCCGLNNAVVV